MNARVIIAEDEPLARDRLRCCLAHHDNLDLIAEAPTGPAAVQLIDDLDPDLLLLDVRLPQLSGFDVLRAIRRRPAVIFTTAYDQYAMTAFEWGAFDYLLKPFGPDRFHLAVQRFFDRATTRQPEAPLAERLRTAADTGILTRFFVRHAGAIIPVHVADILYLSADDDYSAVHLPGKRYLVYLPLREFARRLPDQFVRVHRSAIVNLAYLAGIEQRDNRPVAVLQDGSCLPISRAGVQNLRPFQLSKRA